jgi:hypothetical protein
MSARVISIRAHAERKRRVVAPPATMTADGVPCNCVRRMPSPDGTALYVALGAQGQWVAEVRYQSNMIDEVAGEFLHGLLAGLAQR